MSHLLSTPGHFWRWPIGWPPGLRTEVRRVYPLQQHRRAPPPITDLPVGLWTQLSPAQQDQLIAALTQLLHRQLVALGGIPDDHLPHAPRRR